MDKLREVAAEIERPLAQVALAWARSQNGVSSLIIGATKIEQLRDNIASLEIELTPAQLAKLDEVSAPTPTFPYSIFSDEIRRGISGGANVRG